ncbi:MAG: leucine-rich repeat protein [Muribaculaceae bacterium]|nr:leucine-rich repeat protein [Muribaculaceae bacterium]
MNTPTKYLSVLGIALILGACSDDSMHLSPESDSQQLPITLSAAYPTSTRASDDGFEDGDCMGVYVMDHCDNMVQEITSEDIHAANVKFEFNGMDNKWNANTPIYWTSKDTPADIIGYYPYSESITTPKELPFSINRRQDLSGSENEMGGYETSDFLWAKATKAMPTNSKVDLTFNHIMAGVRVTLKEGSGFGSGEWTNLEKSVFISNIKPSTLIDLSNGKTGEAYGSEISVSAYRYGDDWRAIVVPQTIESGRNIIDISIDGISYQLKKETIINYISGKLSTFTIEVNKRNNTGGYEFNIIDESLNPWIDDVEFRDGIVRNYMTIHVEERGTLKEYVTRNNLALSSLKNLKLTGNVDENDFSFLRDECFALSSLNLSDATTWFGDREFVIPEKAMYSKGTLSHIVFPKNLKIIGSSAFFKTGLTGSLIIPEGVVKIGETYDENNVGWTNISNLFEGTFVYCNNLVGDLILPSTLEFIEDYAFSHTKFTGTLTIPESTKVIGNLAFEQNKFTGDLVIPESVETIGAGAFAGIPFTGNLVLPSKIKTINACTFENCGFSGTLTLHEGIEKIERNAFLSCGFKGELKLPSTLKRISKRAFAETKISGVVFPENLIYIGDGAFMECKYLRGTVEIPKKVERINEYLFCGCSQLSEVILHEDIHFVGGAAFYGCNILNRFVCNAIEPPKLSYIEDNPYWIFNYDANNVYHVGPFHGLALNNFTLEVPKESIEKYNSSEGWCDFKRISEYSNFICRPSSACALNSTHIEQLVVNSDGEWEVIEKPEWCSLSKTSGNLKGQVSLTINQLSKGAGNREGKIVFRLKGTEITSECKVSQYDYAYDEDQCITLQKATKGNGIDVLFLGDGWDAESIANGSYLNLVNEQMEDFFGVEPYTTYRDRFNVYACINLSQETGINTTSTWRNTKFLTFYAHDCDGNGYLGLDDIDGVFDYAVNHTPLTKDNMWKSLVILTLNSDEYGSNTNITESGSTVSICCSSEGTYPMDTRGIIQHEACGHGFGKLAEERIIKNKYVSDKEKNDISKYQWRGWYQNISLSGKMNEVPWSELIFDPRYSDKVDVFEGAYGKARGVYRAEINSCMNYGIPYFSAAARMDIMRRILEYSGEGFTMEKFYATDSDKWGSTGSTRAAMSSDADAYINSGMHHPVRIIKSKKY